VTGLAVPVSPAASVRGPTHIVKHDKPPVLEPDEARALLDSIGISTVVGLRDRGLIGLIVYSSPASGLRSPRAVCSSQEIDKKKRFRNSYQ
jgi:hypothetical protein